jgi:hypothetical protein
MRYDECMSTAPSRFVILGLVALLGAAEARGADRAGKARPETPPPACVEAKRGGPGDVVRALYAAYPWEGSEAVQNEPREVLARYFDERMTDLLLKDRECVKREGGLCNITAALLYAAQDAEIVDFRLCESARGPEWIDVRFRNFGTDVVIAFRTTRTKAGWRVADLVYDHVGSLAASLARPM